MFGFAQAGGNAGYRRSRRLNGANAMSDMEGKLTRVGASDPEQRTSFKMPRLPRPNQRRFTKPARRRRLQRQTLVRRDV